MKLSQYPYLVQKETLDNIKFWSLFLLSFVSNKMKKLIKSSQNDRLKNIKSIRYTCDDTNKQPIIHILFENNWKEGFMEINEREKTENDYFQLNVSGKLIDFRLSNRYEKNLVASFNPDDLLLNRFTIIFVISSAILWSTTRTSDFENIIPGLQNMSACIKMKHVDPNSANIENFFSASPDLKWLRIDVLSLTELTRSGSKVYRAESIETFQLYSDSLPVLRHFQGKPAFVYCVECYTKDLMEFVMRWKSGEAFQKLEHEIGI